MMRRGIDSEEKLHKCNQCEYASSQKGHLNTHIKTHNGEKLHKCSQCEYTSSTDGNLRRHMLLHKCNQCGNAFARASHLVIHLKVHTGDKSYTCNQCKLLQAIWIGKWKHTAEKSPINATSVLMLRSMQVISEAIGKNILGKRHTNVTNVNMHHLHYEIRKDISWHILVKSLTNAISVEMLIHEHIIWTHIWKDTMGKKPTDACSVIFQPFMQKVRAV